MNAVEPESDSESERQSSVPGGRAPKVCARFNGGFNGSDAGSGSERGDFLDIGRLNISRGTLIAEDQSTDKSDPPDPLSSFGHVFAPYLKKLPHSPDLQYLDAKVEFFVENIASPIGICLLPSGNIVVGVTGEDAVKIYSVTGAFLQTVKPSRDFRRPSDMVALPDGRFAVRDDFGIQLFDEEGLFLQKVADGYLGRCYGLATDGRGHLITLNTAGRMKGSGCHNPTTPGQTDVFVIEVESGRVERRIELCDIIPKSAASKCRFLQYKRNKLYIVDLGLDLVYVMDLKTMSVRTFGGTGKGKAQFSDPAGIAVDRKGFMVVADSRNHRLQMFDRSRQYIGLVKLDRPVRRPSGILFDEEAEPPAIYVLNLWGDSMAKYVLQM